MNYEEALGYSNEIISLLFHYCMRIEPTGALRRKETKIDSIEMIAAPQIVDTNSYWNDHASDLGYEVVGSNRLEAGIQLLVGNGVLKRIRDAGSITARTAVSPTPCYGLQYRQVTVIVYPVIAPSDWGVEFLLRTGDDDFVDFLVKKAAQKGFALTRGRLEKRGKPIGAREEADVLRALDLEWVEPENRNHNFIDWKGIS